MKKLTAQMFIGLVFALSAAAVNASLITDEITVRAQGETGVTCTVGTNCNGLGDIGFDNLLVGANSISVDVQQWLFGYTLEFRDLDWVGVPDGELLDVVLADIGCCYGGGGDPFISNVTAHGFDLSYFHQVPDQGEIIVMNLITNHTVPVPAPLVLIGLALVGLGWTRRRSA